MAGKSPRRAVAISLPNNVINPRDGGSETPISFKSVVLPAPESPVRKVNDPASSENVTSRSTFRPGAVAHADIFEANLGLDHTTWHVPCEGLTACRYFRLLETSSLMILTCPQCETRYQVSGSKFPAAGRNVRCAKCGNDLAPDRAGARTRSRCRDRRARSAPPARPVVAPAIEAAAPAPAAAPRVVAFAPDEATRLSPMMPTVAGPPRGRLVRQGPPLPAAGCFWSR